MSVSRTDVIHDFWYQRKCRKTNANIQYIGKHFFSYSTEIGALVTIDGKNIGLIADRYFSSTTAQHRSALMYACPYDWVSAPFTWNDDFTNVTQAKMLSILRKRLVQEVRTKTFKNFSKRTAELRARCRESLEDFHSFMHRIYDGFNAREQALFDKLLKQIEDTPENRALWKAERQRVAKATATKNRREKRAKERKERQANQTRVAMSQWLTQPHSLEELVDARYQHKFMCRTDDDQFWKDLKKFDWSVVNQTLDKALYEQVKDDLLVADGTGLFGRTTYRHPSFVYRSDRNPAVLCTSQGVEMPVKEASVVYRAWRKGKVREGMHVGPYIITNLNEHFVQVGCHCIPMQNIEFLGKYLEKEA